MEVYLIRHGETEQNVAKKTISGQSNWTELTKNGIKQAGALGRRLRNEGVMFDEIYSSPSIRTQQTARYCLNAMGLPVSTSLEPRIIEQSQGDWEGKQRDQIYSRCDVRNGLDGDGWNFVPGDVIKGESQAMVAQRMMDWVKGIMGSGEEDKRIAAFTHGLAIKCLLAELFNANRQDAFKRVVDNTSISILNYNPGGFILSKENDTSHLIDEGLPRVAGVFDHLNKRL